MLLFVRDFLFDTFLISSSPHQIRMKEEKEILEHFAGVVSCMKESYQ